MKAFILLLLLAFVATVVASESEYESESEVSGSDFEGDSEEYLSDEDQGWLDTVTTYGKSKLKRLATKLLKKPLRELKAGERYFLKKFTAVTQITAVRKLGGRNVGKVVNLKDSGDEEEDVSETEDDSSFSDSEVSDSDDEDPAPKTPPTPADKPDPLGGRTASAESALGTLATLAEGGDPEVGMVVDTVVALGKQAWTIVQENKAVVHNDVAQEAAAVPKGVTDPFQMGQFSDPQAYNYELRATNYYGIDVVVHDLLLTYQVGGKYQGKGNYIKSVLISTKNLKVLWGMTYTAKATVESVTNVGPVEDPIAGMMINFHCDLSNFLNSLSKTVQWFIRGDKLDAKLLGE